MNRAAPLAAFVALALCACRQDSHPPLALAEDVDLERFMGDWYVIANIPTRIERGAHNAVESYRLADDGTIETTFTFRKDGFDGELKRYTPRGFVREGTGNAVWGMRFVWPVKADYRIAWLDRDYTLTVVGAGGPRLRVDHGPAPADCRVRLPHAGRLRRRPGL